MKEINLQIFNNPEFGKIRTVQKDGEPWFVLKDIAHALEIDNHKEIPKRLDDDEVGRLDFPHPQNPQKSLGMLCVNEPGLYKVIFRSEKPKAKPFTNWVTHDVLPSIRKTGTYAMPGRRAPDVSPSGLAKLIAINRRVMLEMGATPVEIGAMASSVMKTYNIPVPAAFSRHIPQQLSFFDQTTLSN